MPESPILLWQPSGGNPPGAPGTTPPIYSQSDITQLIEGQEYIDVVFGTVQTDDDWVLVACEVENTTDFEPLNIWPGIMTDRTAAGFRVQLNGLPDSENYYLRWAVSGVNILPVPASLYLFTGPTSGAFGVDKTFTVKLPPSTTLATSITVTPDDGGAGGTFTPPSVVLSSGSALQTFTYTAVAYGAATLSVTNSGTLLDPAPIVFTSIAPVYTFTGPTGGDVGVPSTNFTVLAAGEAVFAVPTTVTPSSGGGGGTFTPTSVLLVAGVPVHFTYTPASTGAKTISVTNDGGLTDPGSLTYTVASVVHLLDTLIAYWGMDEASGTRTDSSGAGLSLTPINNPLGVSGKINNAAQFVAASSQYMGSGNSVFQVTSDFTFSFWIKFTTQVLSVPLAKWDGSGLDYSFVYDPANGIQLGVNLGGGGTVVQGPIIANGVWTHVAGWYDSGSGQVKLRINDATTYQHAAGAALVQTTALFSIGATATPGFYTDGLIDEAGFWKRILTASEITALYNGGAGLPFSSFTA